MGDIADFTESELWNLRTSFRERYHQDIAVQLADTQMRLDRHSTQLHRCPAAYREHDR